MTYCTNLKKSKEKGNLDVTRIIHVKQHNFNWKSPAIVSPHVDGFYDSASAVLVTPSASYGNLSVLVWQYDRASAVAGHVRSWKGHYNKRTTAAGAVSEGKQQQEKGKYRNMASDTLRGGGESSNINDDIIESLKTCVTPSPSKTLNNMCLAAWKSSVDKMKSEHVDKMKSDMARKFCTAGTKMETAKKSDENGGL
jgi:hypothetical protein